MIDLRLGDCLEIMPTLPEASIDLILADLPYGTTVCKWDVVIPFEPLWACYRRLLKPRGAVVITASQPFASMLVMSNREWFKYEIIWEKHKAIGFLWANKRPNACHENILVFSEGWTTYNPQYEHGKPYCRGHVSPHESEANAQSHKIGYHFSESIDGSRLPRSVLKIKNADLTDGRFHPTQKPIALMEYLIRTYSNEGDTILDNAMGSGTTLVACVNTDRNGIGIERDPAYLAIADRRIADTSLPLLEVSP